MRNCSILLISMGVACGAALALPAADDGEYRIPPSDMAKVQRQALLGDPKAAYRLLQDAALAKGSDSGGEATFWLAIAAENGHAIAQYNLGAKLLGEADPRDQVRAEYWLNRAAKAGDTSAAQLLKRVRKGQLATRPGKK